MEVESKIQAEKFDFYFRDRFIFKTIRLVKKSRKPRNFTSFFRRGKLIQMEVRHELPLSRQES